MSLLANDGDEKTLFMSGLINDFCKAKSLEELKIRMSNAYKNFDHLFEDKKELKSSIEQAVMFTNFADEYLEEKKNHTEEQLEARNKLISVLPDLIEQGDINVVQKVAQGLTANSKTPNELKQIITSAMSRVPSSYQERKLISEVYNIVSRSPHYREMLKLINKSGNPIPVVVNRTGKHY